MYNNLKFQGFPDEFKLRVERIGPHILGDKIKALKEADTNEFDEMKIQFLKAAIHLFPSMLEDRADLENAAFIFALPGTQFILISGKGDWEYYFSQDVNDNKIIGRCNRKPWREYIWDGIKFIVSKIPEYMSTARAIIDAVRPSRNALEGRLPV